MIEHGVLSNLLRDAASILYGNLTRITNIVAILKLILLYFSRASSNRFEILSWEFYLGLIVVSVGLNLLLNLLFYSQTLQMQEKWSKETILKLTPTGKWESAAVSGISIGDLIEINSDTICPADLLVIDSSDMKMKSKIVLVNESKIMGKNKMTRKSPIKEFKETDDSIGVDIPSLLNGHIEYGAPNAHEEETLGTFKLKGDPKVIPIKSKNVIWFGTTIHTKQVVGMVLYTKHDSKIFVKNGIRKVFDHTRVFRKSVLLIMIDKINTFFLILAAFTSFFFMIYFDHHEIPRIRVAMIESVNDGSPYWIKYFQIMPIVGSVIPTFLTVLQELIFFLSTLKIQSWKFNLKPALQEEKPSEVDIYNRVNPSLAAVSSSPSCRLIDLTQPTANLPPSSQDQESTLVQTVQS